MKKDKLKEKQLSTEALKYLLVNATGKKRSKIVRELEKRGVECQ